MLQIINVEVLMLIHRTFCQYAPTVQYQYVYPYTQGAYYERYANNEYGLNRDIRKRQQYVGYDKKCSKKYCKNKQEKTDEGSCCQCPNENTGNYYQNVNQDCNVYQTNTSTPGAPYNSFYPIRFITAPHIMFKPVDFKNVLNLIKFTTTAKSVTTSSLKSDEGKKIHDEDTDDTTDEVYSEPELSSMEATPILESEYDDTQSTPPLFITKKTLLFKESSKKRLCPQRECIKKIGKYYVNDIIARPTLGYRQKRYFDANDITVSSNF